MSRRWCEGPINYAGSQRTKRILYPFYFIMLYVPYAAMTYAVAYELFFSRWIMICVFAGLSCFQMEYTIMPESIALFDSAWASQIQVVCMTNRIQNPILVGFFQQWLFDTRERRKRCSDEEVKKDLGKLRLPASGSYPPSAGADMRPLMHVSTPQHMLCMLRAHPPDARSRGATAGCRCLTLC